MYKIKSQVHKAVYRYQIGENWPENDQESSCYTLKIKYLLTKKKKKPTIVGFEL